MRRHRKNTDCKEEEEARNVGQSQGRQKVRESRETDFEGRKEKGTNKENRQKRRGKSQAKRKEIREKERDNEKNTDLLHQKSTIRWQRAKSSNLFYSSFCALILISVFRSLLKSRAMASCTRFLATSG